MKLKNKKLHKDDKKIIINFIDYARLEKIENVGLEIDARRIAEHMGINPDMTNGRLANKFASLLENNIIA